MTNEQYVKLYFPDAYHEFDKPYFNWVWAIYKHESCIIGSSEESEEDAWEDAKQWIESQPDLMNNFKPE